MQIIIMYIIFISIQIYKSFVATNMWGKQSNKYVSYNKTKNVPNDFLPLILFNR